MPESFVFCRFSKALIAVLVLCLCYSPLPVFAGWGNEPGNTPGLTSTETLVLVAVGAVAFVTVLYFVSKSHKKKKEAETDDSTEGESSAKSIMHSRLVHSGTPVDSHSNSLNAHFQYPTQGVTVSPHFGILTLDSYPAAIHKGNFDFSSQAMTVGVSLQF